MERPLPAARGRKARGPATTPHLAAACPHLRFQAPTTSPFNNLSIPIVPTATNQLRPRAARQRTQRQLLGGVDAVDDGECFIEPAVDD